MKEGRLRRLLLVVCISGVGGGDDTIVSGAWVDDGKSVNFISHPYAGYRVFSWFMISNGVYMEIPNMKGRGSYPMTIGNQSSLNVMVSFERIPIYNVKFDANGGTVSPDSVSTGNDGTLDSMPVPARTGYAFEGWYTARTGGTKVTTSSKIEANTTVYAHWTSTRATVTFSAEYGGALTVAVDGAPINSGEPVDTGKSVVFTALPDEGYVVARWTVNGEIVYTFSNGEETVDTASAYTYAVEDSNAVYVTVSFEMPAEPPDSGGAGGEDSDNTLSGSVTVGPNPVRAGGDLAIYWIGSKAVSGNLAIFDVVGGMVTQVNVNGVNKIGKWKVGGIAKGAYLIKGVLSDKDGSKVKVSKLVGVVR